MLRPATKLIKVFLAFNTIILHSIHDVIRAQASNSWKTHH